MQPMRSCTMEWNDPVPFFDWVVMTLLFGRRRRRKKKERVGWGMKSSHLQALIRSQEARCVKALLTSTSILPIYLYHLKNDSNEFVEFYSWSLSLRIMLRFQLSSTTSSFFELYTHTHIYIILILKLKKIKKISFNFFFLFFDAIICKFECT
jgi:hypothetical protein